MGTANCLRCGGNEYVPDRAGNAICRFCGTNYGKRSDIALLQTEPNLSTIISVKASKAKPRETTWVDTTTNLLIFLVLIADVLSLWLELPIGISKPVVLYFGIAAWIIYGARRLYLLIHFDDSRAYDGTLILVSILVIFTKVILLTIIN